MKNYFTTENDIFKMDLSPIAFYVYIYLCRCRDKNTSQCYPSKKTIAKNCGISKSSVSVAINILLEKGLVTREHHFKDSRQMNNVYTVHKLPGVVHITDGGEASETPTPIQEKDVPYPPGVQEINKQDIYNNNSINSQSFNNEIEVTELSKLLKNMGLETIKDYHTRDTLESIISQMYMSDYITVSGIKIPQVLVRKQLDRLDEEILSFVCKKMFESPVEISRGSKYMMACVYNAANEFDLHISREVSQWS